MIVTMTIIVLLLKFRNKLEGLGVTGPKILCALAFFLVVMIAVASTLMDVPVVSLRSKPRDNTLQQQENELPLMGFPSVSSAEYEGQSVNATVTGTVAISKNGQEEDAANYTYTTAILQSLSSTPATFGNSTALLNNSSSSEMLEGTTGSPGPRKIWRPLLFRKMQTGTPTPTPILASSSNTEGNMNYSSSKSASMSTSASASNLNDTSTEVGLSYF